MSKFNPGDKVRCTAIDAFTSVKTEIGKIYTVYRVGSEHASINERAISLKEIKGLFWEWCFELIEEEKKPEIKVGDRAMRKVWQSGDKEEHTVVSVGSIGLPPKFFATLEDGSSCSVDSLLLISKDPQQDFLEGDVWANEDRSQVFKIISIYEKEPYMGASKKLRKRIGCLSLKDSQEYVKGELAEINAKDMKRLLPNLLHRESSEQATCAWFLVEHSPEEHTYNSKDYWVTDCGKTHHDVFGPKGPVEEEYTHCPRCGRKLERTYRN